MRAQEITSVEYVKTNSFFVYFKSKVYGETFSKLNVKFCKPKYYELRKTFLVFLKYLKNSDLYLNDLHCDNIMYDFRKKRWEVIDSSVSKKTADLKNQFMYFSGFQLNPSDFIINKLIEIAESNRTLYTEEEDAALIEKIYCSDLKEIGENKNTTLETLEKKQIKLNAKKEREQHGRMIAKKVVIQPVYLLAISLICLFFNIIFKNKEKMDGFIKNYTE